MFPQMLPLIFFKNCFWRRNQVRIKTMNYGSRIISFDKIIVHPKMLHSILKWLNLEFNNLFLEVFHVSRTDCKIWPTKVMNHEWQESWHWTGLSAVETFNFPFLSRSTCQLTSSFKWLTEALFCASSKYQWLENNNQKWS